MVNTYLYITDDAAHRAKNVSTRSGDRLFTAPPISRALDAAYAPACPDALATYAPASPASLESSLPKFISSLEVLLAMEPRLTRIPERSKS